MTQNSTLQSPPAHRIAAPRLGPIVTAVAAASFLLPLAVTAPAVSLADYAGALKASSSETQWVQDGYNAMFAGMVLIAGSAADKFGRRNLLALGITVFGICSLAIGLSSSPSLIVVLRIVEGLGAGGILAAGGALLASVATGKARTTAFGILGASFGTGLALGPILAGVLDGWGWRASYLLIAVIAAVSLAGVLRYAPNTAGDRNRQLDLAGMASFGACVMAISVALVVAPTSGWVSPITLIVAATAIVAGCVFVLVELRSDEPLFDIRMLANKQFTTVICQPFTITFGFVILLVYLPVYLQSTSNVTALAAAAALLPLTLPVMAIPPAAPLLLRRASIKTLLVVGSLCIAVGSAVLALTLRANDTELAIWPGLLLFGIGVGLAFAVMDNAAITSVPTTEAGIASGMFNTVRITGESLAISGAGAFLLLLTRATGGGSDPHSAESALQGTFTPVAATAFTDAMRITLLVVAALAGIGTAVTARNLTTNK